MKFAPLLFACVTFALGACVANTARQMTPLPARIPLLSHSGSQPFETADKWSFSQAVISYPAGGDQHHRIPVGEYLLGRLLEKSPQLNLKLVRFDSSADTAFGVFTRCLLSLDVEIAYYAEGQPRRFLFQFERRDIGPFFVGENSVIPFTSAGPSDDGLFHNQLRPIIDEIVDAFFAQSQSFREQP